MVGVKLGLIDIGPRRNRAFQRVKCFLRLLRSDASQPGDSRFLVRRTFRQSKAVSHDQKRAVRPGMVHPAEVFILLHFRFYKFAIGPIAHRIECDLAVHQLFDGLIPSQICVVRIQVFLHLRKIRHRLFDLGIVPLHSAAEVFGGRMQWDDPKVKQAMAYFAKMQEYLNPDHADLTWDQAVKELMDGKVAFNSMGDWADGEFIKAKMKENEDFGWVNHPGTDGSFLIVADGFTLAKGAPHKESAIAWLRSVGTKEAQEAFNPLKGSIPARTDVDKSKFDAYHRWSMEEFAKDKLLPSCVHGGAAPEAFQKALNEAVSSFVLDKNVDNFATALAQASKKVAPIVSKLQFSSETIALVSPDLPPGAPPQYAEDVKGAGKLNI